MGDAEVELEELEKKHDDLVARVRQVVDSSMLVEHNGVPKILLDYDAWKKLAMEDV